MSALENRIPPPLVALILAIGLALAARWLPPTPVGLGTRLLIALPVAALALSFALPAFRAFNRAGTTINPVRIDEASKLVTGGVYAVTRNPMYVGLAGLLTAIAIGLGNPLLLLAPLLFMLFITRFQIIPEERVMLRKFGEDYAAYKARVRRWL